MTPKGRDAEPEQQTAEDAGTDYYAPNQQAVRGDASGPAEEGEGGAPPVEGTGGGTEHIEPMDDDESAPEREREREVKDGE